MHYCKPIQLARANRLIMALFAAAALFSGCKNHQSAKGPSASAVNVLKPPFPWMQPFIKIDSVNPVLSPGTGSFVDPISKKTVLWEEKDVFNPAIVKKDGKVYMLYRAQDKVGKPGGTSRVGLAVSNDGLHFKRMPKPVLYPENDGFKKYEWEGGCEDPRVVRDDNGMYYMMYTAYEGTTARLFVATSTNLLSWKKYGSVFGKAYNGKYALKWSKSGSVVSRYIDGEPVAVKINGKYWMYWGDSQIWCATSDDLINWTPVEMKKGEHPPVKLRGQATTVPDLKVVLPTRDGMFDSNLVESGPPAMLTDAGILLLYNSMNEVSFGDKSLPEGSYDASQVLFDKNEPTKIIRSMNTYFMTPDKPYEITSQVNQVCFIERLTQIGARWYLYYGTADSKIAVAATKGD